MILGTLPRKRNLQSIFYSFELGAWLVSSSSQLQFFASLPHKSRQAGKHTHEVLYLVIIERLLASILS